MEALPTTAADRMCEAVSVQRSVLSVLKDVFEKEQTESIPSPYAGTLLCKQHQYDLSGVLYILCKVFASSILQLRTRHAGTRSVLTSSTARGLTDECG